MYKHFSKEAQHHVLAVELPSCFHEIKCWMYEHFLQVNPGKTKIVILWAPSVLSKLTIHGSFLSDDVCVRFVSSVITLRFTIDSSLTLHNQIRKVKSACFDKLRDIAKMKTHLNYQQIRILIQSLVISSLDYCNALYFNIDQNSLNQLQSIQNRACCIIFG